jgi:hypothetical protein
MPSKNRITLNPPRELIAAIRALQSENALPSEAGAALVMLLAGAKALGYDVPDAVPGWGGKREASIEKNTKEK